MSRPHEWFPNGMCPVNDKWQRDQQTMTRWSSVLHMCTHLMWGQYQQLEKPVPVVGATWEGHTLQNFTDFTKIFVFRALNLLFPPKCTCNRSPTPICWAPHSSYWFKSYSWLLHYSPHRRAFFGGPTYSPSIFFIRCFHHLTDHRSGLIQVLVPWCQIIGAHVVSTLCLQQCAAVGEDIWPKPNMV